MNTSTKIGAGVALGIGGAVAWMLLSPVELPAHTLPPVPAGNVILSSVVTQDNIQDTICKDGWSALPYVIQDSYRYDVMNHQFSSQAYAVTDPLAYTESYIVPPSLGGSPKDQDNMWPEPITNDVQGQNLGVAEKLVTDQWLHDQVCTGVITLEDAQNDEINNWVDAYKEANQVTQ